MCALLWGGCVERAPSIIEARITGGHAELGLTPFEAHIRAQGGDAPLSAKIFLGVDQSSVLSGVCEAPQLISGRGHRSGEPLALSPAEVEDLGVEDLGVEDLGVEDLGVDAQRRSGCVTQSLQRSIQGDEVIFVGSTLYGPSAIGESLYYRIEIKDRDGDVARWPTSGTLTLIVSDPRVPLTVTHISPREGPTSGETRVLIKGSGWTDQAPLSLSLDGHLLTRTRVESPHLISGYTPQGMPGRYATLKVENAGRVVRLPEAFYWTPPPTVERLTPAEGPSGQVNRALLEGTSFIEPTVIDDQGQIIPSEQLSDHALTLSIPSGPQGPFSMYVQNSDGQRTSLSFFRWDPPTLSELTPHTGPDDTPTWILLSGENLRRPGAVWFDRLEAYAVEVNDAGTTARVRTPLHPGGVSSVRYVNPDGQSSTLVEAYRFMGPPRLLDATPREVSRCGGGVLTLIGVHLSLEMSVLFNGSPVEVLEVNEAGTEAIVRAPSGGQGSISVTLIGVDGRRTRRDDLLRYGLQPVLNLVTPRRAPIWGGTSALFEGSDLIAGTLFYVGGRLVEEATFLSDGCRSVVEVIIPPGEGEGVQIDMDNPAGDRGILLDAVDYIAPQFSPREGLSAGYTNLTLTGLDLREGLSVRFAGAAPRQLTRVSDAEWQVLTPASDVGPTLVELYNVDGRGVSSEAYYTTTHFIDESGGEGGLMRGECNDAQSGDLNGDGWPDIIMAMGSNGPVGQLEQPARVLLNDGRGALLDGRALSPIGNGMNVRLGDVDQDGDLDALMINLFSERNFFWLNDGLGSFAESSTFPRTGPSYDGALVDADGDGDLDAFLMQTGDVIDNDIFGPEQLLLNEDLGERWVDRSSEIDFNLDDVHDHDMNHGDFNEDGLEDIVIVVDTLPQSFPGASNRLLLNRGGGRFERVPSPLNNYPGDWLDVVIGDLDGDGHLDIMLPQDYIEGISIVGTPSVAVFIGDGQGGFTDESDRVRDMPNLPAFGATAIDLDHDGDLDLMVAVYGVTYSDGTIEPFESVLLLNDGQGNLYEANRSFRSMPLSPSSHFEVVDLDLDGRFDMVECAAEGRSRIWRQRQEP